MTFQPTTEGALCRIKWTSGDIHMENHLWFRQTDFDGADLALLAEAVYGFAEDYWLGSKHTSIHLNSVEAIDMRTQGAESRVYQESSPAGEQTGDVDSLALALVLTVRTIYRGRSYRGRIYLNGFGEDAKADGQYTSTLVNAMVASFDYLLAAITGTGFTYGVRTGQLDGVKRPSGLVIAATSWECRSSWPGTQRRRVHRG